MSKTTQMMKLNVFGTRFSVVYHHDDDTGTPFWLYNHWNAYDKYGVLRERKKLIGKHPCFQNCLCSLTQMNILEFKKMSWEVSKS